VVPRVYDLVLTHALDTDDFFIQRVQRRCAEAGLNFFLVEPLWAPAFLDALRQHRVAARSLINLHSEHHAPEDVFSRLVALAETRGVRMIDPPSKALRAFDKAAMHPRLIHAGIHVPPTVILDAKTVATWRPDEAQTALLGSPFVIKPSLGYGRRGVLLDATGPADIARSQRSWPDRAILAQKKIEPTLLDGEPGYFRVYHVAGKTWACWWNCFTDRYRELTTADTERLGLGPLHKITRRIAGLSGLILFSTEICLDQAGEFVVIDYVNDQIHLLTQSAHPAIGMPDRIVVEIADALVALVGEWLLPAKANPSSR
jgi:hypothetical protein